MRSAGRHGEREQDRESGIPITTSAGSRRQAPEELRSRPPALFGPCAGLSGVRRSRDPTNRAHVSASQVARIATWSTPCERRRDSSVENAAPSSLAQPTSDRRRSAGARRPRTRECRRRHRRQGVAIHAAKLSASIGLRKIMTWARSRDGERVARPWVSRDQRKCWPAKTTR